MRKPEPEEYMSQPLDSDTRARWVLSATCLGSDLRWVAFSCPTVEVCQCLTFLYLKHAVLVTSGSHNVVIMSVCPGQPVSPSHMPRAQRIAGEGGVPPLILRCGSISTNGSVRQSHFPHCPGRYILASLTVLAIQAMPAI